MAFLPYLSHISEHPDNFMQTFNNHCTSILDKVAPLILSLAPLIKPHNLYLSLSGVSMEIN